jgi:hypothetical protein
MAKTLNKKDLQDKMFFELAYMLKKACLLTKLW